MSAEIVVGDMREKLHDIAADSIDSCVTDPPYHLTSIVKRFGREAKSHLDVAEHKDLTKVKAPQYKRLSRGFMGEQWDGGDVAFQPETWAAVFRVLKPGAHLVAFSGTRTYHRMVCAIEDAGFEIRDQLAWCYGSGFPKSHNAGDGWGTALKPAWEPICLARKPLIGTVAANVLQYGTGAINIDGCRIETADDLNGGTYSGEQRQRDNYSPTDTNADAPLTRLNRGIGEYQQPLGRWPANIIHDGSEEVLAGFPDTGLSSGGRIGNAGGGNVENIPTGTFSAGDPGFGDSGSAARFFYCAKADSSERHIGGENKHPTVKPIDLMRWLVRLVTPKGGTVLDPFTGSGSTLIAADREQFNAIGIELSPEYAEIARKRISGDRGGLLDAMEAA